MRPEPGFGCEPRSLVRTQPGEVIACTLCLGGNVLPSPAQAKVFRFQVLFAAGCPDDKVVDDIAIIVGSEEGANRTVSFPPGGHSLFRSGSTVDPVSFHPGETVLFADPQVASALRVPPINEDAEGPVFRNSRGLPCRFDIVDRDTGSAGILTDDKGGDGDFVRDQGMVYLRMHDDGGWRGAREKAGPGDADHISTLEYPGGTDVGILFCTACRKDVPVDVDLCGEKKKFRVRKRIRGTRGNPVDGEKEMPVDRKRKVVIGVILQILDSDPENDFIMAVD